MTESAFGRHSPSSTALVIVDMQNDFLHPDGAYARGGVSEPMLGEAASKMLDVHRAARAAGVMSIATLFTLVPGPDGPLISDHLHTLRPFLTGGDFEPHSWGQKPIDGFDIDLGVEKVAYSAFHASRLEFVLDQLGITSLIVGGIVTNGGVASTVRHAHVLGIDTTVLEDGCAAFSADAHNAAIASMATIVPVTTCSDAIRWFESRGAQP